MNRSTSLLVVAALFLSGVAIGALGMHLYYWQTLGSSPRGGFMRWQGPTPMVMGWMERELDLTAEQREAIRDIVADSMRRGGEMRDEMRPRVEELMRETSDRIAAVLTEEQRRRYQELRDRRGRHFERGFLGPPGGRGPMRYRSGSRQSPPPPRDP